MSELKPCEECGYAGPLRASVNLDCVKFPEEERRWSVSCPDMDCRALPAYGRTEQEAITAWNTRQEVKGDG